MTEASDFDGTKDNPRIRTYPMTNGTTVSAEKDGTFGFWSLSVAKGSMPPDYQGRYSSIEEVEKAVKQYAAGRDLVQGVQPPRPKVEFKTKAA